MQTNKKPRKIPRKKIPFSVTWMVNRLHVGESNRGVIRAIWTALKKEARHNRKLRRSRHFWYRCAIQIHAENRGLYQHVMHRI